MWGPVCFCTSRDVARKSLRAHMGYRDKETRLRMYFGGFDPIVTSSAMRLSGCLTERLHTT